MYKIILLLALLVGVVFAQRGFGGYEDNYRGMFVFLIN